MSSRLISKNVEIKVYKIVNFPVVLCDYGTWSPTWRTPIVLRTGYWEYLDVSGKKKETTGENLITRCYVIVILHQTLLELSNREGWDGRYMKDKWGHENFVQNCSRKTRREETTWYTVVDARTILALILKEKDMRK